MAKERKDRSNLLAGATYALPLIYLLSSLSETLSLLPALIFVGSGIVFALVFKNNELVKFHGVQSCVFNLLPQLLLLAISQIFISTGYLMDETGFSVYMTVYTTLMLFVFFLPLFGLYNALKGREGNLPLITKGMKQLADLIK